MSHPARITAPLDTLAEIPDQPAKQIVVGISGASGAHYACRLLELLLVGGHEVHLVASDYGRRLLHDEGNLRRQPITKLTIEQLVPDALERLGEQDVKEHLYIHPYSDVGAVIASGSFVHDGMAVIPCSSTSLGAIATGAGSNLLTRAAMVTLKERRPLVVCHREMPLSLIDIENLRTLALAGASLCSPNPGFYLNPETIGEIIDFTVGKVLDLLDIKHTLATRWTGSAAKTK